MVMERLTEKTVGCFEYALKDHKAVPGEFGTYDAFFDYSMAVKRLGHYEDTGLEPEEINDMALEVATLKTIESMYDGFGKPDHIRDLLQADQAGRLVVLDEPMRPLVWGDKEHDTILCPRCLCDLMGGFEYAPSCETVMFQCPHCGQPIKSDKVIDMEQSEAEAALAQKGGEG